MTANLKRALVNHVLRVFNLPLFDTDFDLRPYLNTLPRGSALAKLTQILTALDGSPGIEQLPLVLEKRDDASNYVHRQAGGDPATFLRKGVQPDPGEDFESWMSLIYRAARTTPGTLREAGVSLYHEFKALSAIAHASIATTGDPKAIAPEMMLISGDFPGVQRIIYTITSDKATKGVRGRSFFLQLLAECVVRRFLDELGNLPTTNAIYVAGGNFLILAPPGAEKAVADITREINKNLLDIYKGDLALVTATQAVETTLLAEPDALRDIYKDIKESEGKNKLRLFADVALEKVFGAYGSGGTLFCRICQREPENDIETNEAKEAERWICPDCRAFEELAVDLAERGTAQPYLIFEPAFKGLAKEDISEYTAKLRKRYPYADYLLRITGWACRVEERNLSSKVEGVLKLQLNNLDFDPDVTSGFRVLAVHTPLVTYEDITWLLKDENKHRRDKRAEELRKEGREEEDALPKAGTIRDFEMIAARRSPGFERLGVLRMDVDGLGDLFKNRLKPMTLTRLMAASDALSLFFELYLPELCEAFEQKHERPHSLYLLYGGGDDLFIVGEWDLIPYLAQEIRNEFSTYTAGNLSISAGIELVHPNFPFYQAANMAKEALDDGAKAYDRSTDPSQKTNGTSSEPKKDAISFLSAVMSWRPDEIGWKTVVNEQESLVRITSDIKQNTVIRNVLNIYLRWHEDKRLRNEKEIYYGPYIWLAAYQMSRIAEEHKELKPYIKLIQKHLMKPETIQLSGLAARWAEFKQRSSIIGD